MKKLTIVLIMSSLTLMGISGCMAGKHCIAVDGSYDGIEGGIEYCYDAGKSEEVKAPVYVSPDGKVAVLLTERAAKMALLQKDNTVDIKTLDWKTAFGKLLKGNLDGKRKIFRIGRRAPKG